MSPLPWQCTFLRVSAFLGSMWKTVWQRVSHRHQRDQPSKMASRLTPVVATFHTHPQVNKEAALAVVGDILVSPSASVVQMYLHRSHTTDHVLKPAQLAAEPTGSHLPENQALPKIIRQHIEAIGQWHRVLIKFSRGTGDLYNNQAPPLPQESLCKQNCPCHTIPCSANASCRKCSFNHHQTQILLYQTTQTNISHGIL